MDYHFQEIDSTNQWMKQHAESLESMSIVMADFQRAGRGQRGNGWESSPGKNLLMSLMFIPDEIYATNQFHISEMASLAVWRVVKSLIPKDNRVEIKWPNDIYVNDRKVCGMLIENSLERGGLIRHSIIGIGLNLNQMIFSVDIPNPGSLLRFMPAEAPEFAPEPVAHRIRDCFRDCYSVYQTCGHQKCHEEYLDSLRGRGVYLSYAVLTPSSTPAPTALLDGSGHEIIEATIEGVASDGRLDMLLRDGSRRSFYFKEITPLLCQDHVSNESVNASV